MFWYLKIMKTSLQALKVFEAAARLGSFKDAAAEMNISPTAVSHHIGNLENRLNQNLFVRKVREVSLTPNGLVLAHATTDAFRRIEAALEALSESGERLSVTTTSSFASLVLIPAMQSFTEMYPNIEVDISTGESLTHDPFTLPIRFGNMNHVSPSDLLHRESFDVFGAPAFLEKAPFVKSLKIFTTKWKNETMSPLPWKSWLDQNEIGERELSFTYYDQELYGIHEAMSGKGAVFCSTTLVSKLVEAGTLRSINNRPVGSNLCYYIPDKEMFKTMKALPFVEWVKTTFA